MKPEKRPSIGIMIGGVHTYFPREMIRGASEQARKEDANVFFFLRIHTKSFFRSILGDNSSDSYDYQFNTVHDYCQLGGMDGVIIGYGTIGFHLQLDNAVQFARKYSGLPLMVVTERVELPNCYSIIADNYHGMFDAVEHLIKVHDCRRILFMRGPLSNTDANERLAGYQAAMRKYGLPVEDDMIGTGDFSSYVDEQVNALLDRYPDADGFVFSNDEMAACGYRVCGERGLRIGEDIRIVGFDGSEFSENLNPPLTTVFQDAAGMSRQAVQDLMTVIRGGLVREERFPVALVERESCGCHPESEKDSAETIDYAQELKHTRAEAARQQQKFDAYQGKSWFLPMMARDLNEIAEDETEFCRVTMEKLQQLNANAAYLFLLDKPLTYDGVSEWKCPEDLYLASCFRKGKVEAYKTFERPKVTRENGIAQLTDDGENHQYMVFLLFSGERQYGLLVCDVPTEELPFFYVVSLQLGLSLRYFELSRIESLRRRKMTADMEQMRERNRELDILSGYDALTGLLNLRGMTDRLHRLASDGGLGGGYVVYCDLDRLKEINDSFGHTEGNFAIRGCAWILSSCIRDTDILARVGGDEFICIVPTDSTDFPEIFRRRLAAACERFNETSGKPYYVGLSAGVAPYSDSDYDALQVALTQADKRLYDAKASRRETVRRDET